MCCTDHLYYFFFFYLYKVHIKKCIFDIVDKPTYSTDITRKGLRNIGTKEIYKRKKLFNQDEGKIEFAVGNREI